MNAVDVVLQDEVGRLMDRLAATVPGGSLEATSATNPTLRMQLDDMEVSLASARLQNVGTLLNLGGGRLWDSHVWELK